MFLLIIQQSNYYSYGLDIGNLYHLYPTTVSATDTLENKYQYNGIELEDAMGINIAMARYRTLDPQLGRWWQVDPEVEQFYAWTPYNSNLGNPIRYEDKDGDLPGPGSGDDPLDDNEQPLSIPEGGFCGGGSFSGCNNYGSTEMGVGQFFLRFLKNTAEEAVQTVAIVGNLISDGDVDTETTKNNKTAPIQVYEVDAYNDLKNRSVAGDGLDIHHVVQGNPAKQTIPGYNYQKGAAIALPHDEHTSIPTQKGTATLTARQQLAKDIKDLRNKTKAPTVSLQKLIELNKQMYGASLSKQNYLDLRYNKTPH